jgi:hypothetical protein
MKVREIYIESGAMMYKNDWNDFVTEWPPFPSGTGRFLGIPRRSARAPHCRPFPFRCTRICSLWGTLVKIELHEKEAPGTVANFEKLAGEGFYNGLKFHSVKGKRHFTFDTHGMKRTLQLHSFFLQRC